MGYLVQPGGIYVPGSSVPAIYAAPIIDAWDASTITGIADGGAVGGTGAEWTGVNGNQLVQATAANQPTYQATAWSDGGPCVSFDGVNDLLSCNALATNFGSYASGGKPFTLAILCRLAVSTGGALFGFGSASGVFAMYGMNNSLINVTKTGGGQGTIANNSPLWMHPWVPADGNSVAQDALIVFGVTQDAKIISGSANNGSGSVRITVDTTYLIYQGQSVTIAGIVGTTEANGTHTVSAVISETQFDINVSFVNAYVSGGVVNGSGSMWFNSHYYAVETGRDNANTYNKFSIGRIAYGASSFAQPLGMTVRYACMADGAPSRRWIAALVEHLGRRDLLHTVTRIGGDSIEVNAADGGNGAWPTLLTLLPSDIGRKATNSAPATLFNAAVAGESIADVLAPSGAPDGNNAYVNGESRTNTFNWTDIWGIGVVGILGVDENSANNYDPDTTTICHEYVGHHEIARQYTARQTVDRYWQGIDTARANAPNNFYVACTPLQAVQTGYSNTVCAAVRALILAEWPDHCDDVVDAGGYAPLQNPSATYYQNEGGEFVHLNSAGRAVMAAYVQTQLARIRARARAKRIAIMLSAT